MKIFNNIGSSLRLLAKVFFYIEFLFALAIGALCIFGGTVASKGSHATASIITILNDLGFREGLVNGLLIIVLGLIFAWLSNCALYAFGQLVEDTHDNKVLLAEIKDKVFIMSNDSDKNVWDEPVD